eukprot:TRINITY_DN2801_c0_g2_i1.p1 TRINITY_DN2801_c0_g2~~TRINITY_DN2801_c0_g2_i1.p1  ORF type:complete len:768 (-),score=150.73 TRINITY_DN2801_c0_g2_i1:159-2462(-)
MIRSFLIVSVLISVCLSAPTTVYDNSLAAGFDDYSWATHSLTCTTVVHSSQYSISMDVEGYQGLYFYYAAGFSPVSIQSLNFWYNSGSNGVTSLSVALISASTAVGTVSLSSFTIPANSWTYISIPISQFNIQNSISQLNGLWFQDTTGASTSVGTVYIDDLAFTLSNIQVSYNATVTLDFSKLGNTINPYIFGVSFGDASQIKNVGYTINRWGGNSATRYSWDYDTQNKANDWYFENYPNTNAHPELLPFNSSSDSFILDTINNGAVPILTLPLIGWTPKDRTFTQSFSVAKYGAQQQSDPYNSDAGNGILLNGNKVVNDPHDTSKQVTVQYSIDFVNHVKQIYSNIQFLQLDNEIVLWSSTHRDVHPLPVGYDEFWNVTVTSAAPLKNAFPNSLIYSPSTWGWCDIYYSGKDNCATGSDSQAHNNVPVLQWFLQQLAAYKQAHNVELVDYLDLHWYPQATNVFSSDESALTQGVRLRSLRALYDPTYVDESWIARVINLLPTIKGWISQYAPWLKLAVSEYNYGDGTITSMLAQAEVLSIFAREGVDSACRWTAPTSGSIIELAYKMYLNYDGKGGKVTGTYVNTTVTSPMPDVINSITAYSFRDNNNVYITLFNKDALNTWSITLNNLQNNAGTYKLYSLNATSTAVSLLASGNVNGQTLSLSLASYSFNLLVVPINKGATSGSTSTTITTGSSASTSHTTSTSSSSTSGTTQTTSTGSSTGTTSTTAKPSHTDSALLSHATTTPPIAYLTVLLLLFIIATLTF